MDFFKNFYNDDDRVVGLCAFKRRNARSISSSVNETFDFERQFGATRLLYEPKRKSNLFC